VTAYDYIAVWQVYEGSNGDATKALYAHLESMGPIGTVAVNLFRASKTSGRAKVYRGRRFRDAAYDTKQWSLDNLCKVLTAHAEALGLPWGWAEDPKQAIHRWVLYVDLPTGQVSFHSGARGDGPAYPRQWDGARGASADRICRWIARLCTPIQPSRLQSESSAPSPAPSVAPNGAAAPSDGA
jgi:hypothetical protein